MDNPVSPRFTFVLPPQAKPIVITIRKRQLRRLVAARKAGDAFEEQERAGGQAERETTSASTQEE